MKEKLDKSQYANKPGVSIKHYLIKLLHRILSETDFNSKGGIKAVIATLIDWKQVFPKQCSNNCIESFIKNDVRPPLTLLLISCLKKNLIVKWHNVTSARKDLPGAGPQGGTFGVWGYQSQSNDNANCVDEEDRLMT